MVLVPLSSQSEAKKAIDQAKETSQAQASPHVDSDASDIEDFHVDDVAGENDQTPPVDTDLPIKEDSTKARPGLHERGSSNVAEDVIGKKGQYGRFAERWFSKKGWGVDKRRMQGMSTENIEKASSSEDGSRMVKPEPCNLGLSEQNTGSIGHTQVVAHTLLPKLLRTTRTLLGSRSFFYSYDLDITRRIGHQVHKSSELPLHKSVDPLFFWNHHLLLPFIESGQHAFILPLMQGFVGQRSFTASKAAETSSSVAFEKQPEPSLDSVNFLLTLISRRSVRRNGLRYLRRGIDDEGNVANFVESEQILSRTSWAKNEKIFSFLQVRGSIPIFFSQSPLSFKPTPVLQRSPETNQRAFERHFRSLVNRYGEVQIVSLVDKKGGESEIGRKYEESVMRLNAGDSLAGKKLGFEWWDFHSRCQGMAFENVNLLIEALESKLEDSVELGGTVQRRQTIVVRTNCIDCIDRSNVVQSAAGQKVLERQLTEEGSQINFLTSSATKFFNTLWADNGDQISRAYAGTSALKGDYTRTRQRNYRGAINDIGLSLSRFYNNLFNGKGVLHHADKDSAK